MNSGQIQRRRLIAAMAVAGFSPWPNLLAENALLPVTPSDGGTVVDRHGTPVDGARVEIWQADNGGVYRHPGDEGKPDKRFQGFGTMVTNRAGMYHFRTLRPVPYTGRTPHIHYRVSAPGFDRLTTQLYVAEESERNSRDVLYKRHTPDERGLLTSSFRVADGGSVAAEFNIVLG